jgi:hypothetical protein
MALNKATFDSPRSPARGAKDAGGVFVLHIPANSNTCEGARLLEGRKLDPKDAPPLPLQSCGSVNCPCRYERVAKRGGGERRGESARRESIRFETKEDRRKRADPRKGNATWTKAR